MRVTPLLSSVGLAALLATGCAVGPDYSAPAAPLPGAFASVAAIRDRQAANPADLDAWWNGFNDPTLASLVAEGLEQNLDIAQASARLSQSRSMLRSADAALLPRVAATGQFARAHQSVETPLGRVLDSTPGFDRNGSYDELNIGASWELDLFGTNHRAREAARADYQASGAATVATRLAIAAQIADTYVALRGLQTRLAISGQQRETRRRLLQTIRLQFEKGIAAELQVDQATGSLSQVEAGIPMLEAAAAIAMNSIDVLLGSIPGSHREQLAAAGPIPVAPGVAPGNPADLLRRRPDLMAAERRLAASSARIGVAVSEYYPRFSLGAAVGTATTQGGNLFSGPANQVQGVLGLRWRLFDFGRIEAEIAAARGRNAEALASYRQVALRATEDVEAAFVTLLRREQQERALEVGENALSRARLASFKAYQGGAVSLIEVLDADANLLATRDAKALAATEATRAAIASFRALGGGWKSEA